MDDAPIIGPEFFDVRYAAGKMPWDFGGVPKSLKVFLDTHHKSGRVLIPGSGSGYEIEAFSSSGWDVIGIDFSKVAVGRARSLLGPLAGKVYEGDFFTYPLREGSFDIIYERTFLCTLPPDFWPRYAQRIAKLVAPAGILCGRSPIGRSPPRLLNVAGNAGFAMPPRVAKPKRPVIREGRLLAAGLADQ